MSRRGALTPDVAIEWSGRGLTLFDSVSGATQSFNDLGTAGAAYGGRTAVIGLSRRSVFLRTMRVPNASEEDVRQILTIRAGDLFPIGVADLAISFRLTEDVDAEGRLAVVCAAPSAELRRIREEARAAGFRVAGVLPVAFGSTSIARGLHNPSAAVVSRDQEGIGIDLVVDGELRQSRVVPANSAVEAEVCRTYTVAGLPCGDIIAADGIILQDANSQTKGSPLSALIDAFPANLGVDMVLPEEVVLRRKRIKDQKMRTAMLLGAAAASVLIFIAKQRMDATNSLDLRAATAQSKIDTANRARKAAETLQRKEEASQVTLDRAFKPAQRLGDVIAAIANDAPADIWLTGLSIDRGKPISVRGTSKTSGAVSAFLDKLNHEPRLRDVVFAFVNTGELERTPVFQFSFTAFPIGNLPLSDPNAVKTARKGKVTQ